MQLAISTNQNAITNEVQAQRGRGVGVGAGGEMAGGGGKDEVNLEFTPTWVVALVCSVIVAISLFVERFLHFLGKYLKKRNQKPLYEALLKVKEELMLMGFISLLLVVLQGSIQNICMSPNLLNHMTPCKRDETAQAVAENGHYGLNFSFGGHGRHLLSDGGTGSGACAAKGKVPLMSITAIHQLHIFIFVLAITHVTLSAITMVLGSFRIRQWKHFEDSIQNDNTRNDPNRVTHVDELKFIRDHFKGMGKDSTIVGWLYSFFKQFYGSVNRTDYATMRLGFIMTHFRGNPKFNFHKYMIRALEADFKKVVGISWYLWVFVVIFLLLNVNGWKTYFWISFVPLALLLAVGAKLEHVIIQLAHNVAEKHTAIEGDLIVNPSDDHFWFHRPKLILHLIHFVLFQNAFEIAYFFWILTTYGYHSCIMGNNGYITPRIVIGVIIQLLCSYSILPLYAIVTQMGSSFKKAIFDDHVQEGLVGWAQKVKKKKALKPNIPRSREKPTDVLLQNLGSQPEISVEDSPISEQNRSGTVPSRYNQRPF